VIGGVDVPDPGRSDVGTENGNGHMKAAFRIVLERSAWSDGWERVETEPASRVVASPVNGGAKEQTALDARRGGVEGKRSASIERRGWRGAWPSKAGTVPYPGA
jgi:hypothetical protein